METQSYTNDLHDALLLKKVPLFGSVGSLNLKKKPKNTQKERASLPFGRYQIITR